MGAMSVSPLDIEFCSPSFALQMPAVDNGQGSR